MNQGNGRSFCHSVALNVVICHMSTFEVNTCQQ